MKILALDVGSKGIGIAKGFAENQMIFPVETLSRKSVKKDSAYIAQLCTKEGIKHVVIGLPLMADGSEGRSARLARQIGDALHEQTQIPVSYEDERDSSVEAQQRLQAAGKNSYKQKAIIDQEAAIVILERWFRNKA